MKNILIYAPIAIFSPHFETDLEIAMRELSKGNKVSILPCKAKLINSCTELARDPDLCIVCKSRFNIGVKLLPQEVEILSWRNLSPRKDYNFDFKSLNDFNNFKYKEIEVGQFIISTFISIYREPKLDFNKHKIKLEKSLNEIIDLIDDFLVSVDLSQFDECYLFNGRFSILYPILKLFQLHDKKFYVHEGAGPLGYYSLSLGTYPHDLDYKKIEILETCKTGSAQDVEQIGQEWYYERRGRSKDESLPSFLSDQVKELLPDNFDTSKRNISIFVSSEDEFVSINGWENPYFLNQNDGIKYILQNLDHEQFKVYIRVHPCLKNIYNSQTEGLLLLKDEFKNAYFIDADAAIDTYALLEKSEKIISFGSTLGIEATFWRIPSLLAGRALYEGLNVCYVPKSKEDLISLINSNLLPRDKSGCLEFAYWLRKHGIKYEFFKPDGHFSGHFLDQKIKPSYLSRIIYKIKKMSKVMKKENHEFQS
ncbi:MAG: hypothetical protein H7336_05975 [Bacteriovorax sp.]|nr:hypothetical protein [Bacteriovorax sp.]